MGKQLILEGKTLERFKEKFGEDVNPANFYCIRVRAVSTEPISQGTIYNGAITTENTLLDMANIVNNTNENVGVLTMHDSDELNIGRCFYAEVEDEGDVKSLTAYMAILKTEDSESVIRKIENNVLDEVSVSFVPRKAKCSKCGFDYMGDGATAQNWYSMTCDNGHEIGKEGTHLIIDGTDNFSEISVVNRGAAESAKILENEVQSFFSEKGLAAKGDKPNKMRIVCFSKMENCTMGNIEKELEEAKAEIAALQQKLDLESKLKELESVLAEKNAVIAELEAKIAEKQTLIEEGSDSLKEKEEELNASKEAHDKVLTFLKNEVSKVLVASNSKEEVPEDLDGISKLLGEKQQILASLIPAGGVSTQINKKASPKVVCGYSVEQLKAFQVKQ